MAPVRWSLLLSRSQRNDGGLASRETNVDRKAEREDRRDGWDARKEWQGLAFGDDLSQDLPLPRVGAAPLRHGAPAVTWGAPPSSLPVLDARASEFGVPAWPVRVPKQSRVSTLFPLLHTIPVSCVCRVVAMSTSKFHPDDYTKAATSLVQRQTITMIASLCHKHLKSARSICGTY